MTSLNSTHSARRSFPSITATLALLVSLASIGCGNWSEFGNGPLNPHNSLSKGPELGITVQADLLPGAISPNFGLEVGVLVDLQGDYYVTSLDNEIQVYDHVGNWRGVYDLGFAGPRAAPYVVSNYKSPYATIFTGTVSGGGGFQAIEVDKTTLPYTLTLMDTHAATGPAESSPKRARDKTFYICDLTGTINRYSYSAGSLTHLGTYSLNHKVKGAIALFDVDPQFDQEEVLVATIDGHFYVLDHSLSVVIWSSDPTSTPGVLISDNYYAGVTVAERGLQAPVALLPIAGGFGAPNSGKLRAFDLQAQAIAWELTPSNTSPGDHAIEGSVAVLFDQSRYLPPNPTNPGGGIVIGGGGNDLGGGLIIDPNPNTNPWGVKTSRYHATFASSDRFLYGVDIASGLEIWRYGMTAGGYDAPVVDGHNVIYVGDGRSILHAVEGKISCAGCGLWIDPTLAGGGATDIVKLGVTNKNALVVGTNTSAYAVFQ